MKISKLKLPKKIISEQDKLKLKNLIFLLIEYFNIDKQFFGQ